MFVTTTGAITINSATISIEGGSMSANTWNHFAATRTGNTVRLFLNGSLVNTTTAFTDNPNTSTMYIGSLGNGAYPANCYLDSVRISNNCRYTASFTVPSAAFSSGTPQVLTLPTAANNTNLYSLKNIHATDPVTVATTSSQTIDGSSSATLIAGQKASFVSDGSNWRTV
jgi:hypothetical protein